jgi:secondary thiamine-phosphate synthase enzyme
VVKIVTLYHSRIFLLKGFPYKEVTRAMTSPIIHCVTLTKAMAVGLSLEDITGELSAAVQESGIKDGVLHATAIGSTVSLTTIEHEPGVIEDLKRAITRLAPPGLDYEHERAWHDGNGHSHVQAALLGPSLSVPIRNGKLALGTWQQAVLINHDNRARQRRVEVTLIGR